jgi:hypothetical protein
MGIKQQDLQHQLRIQRDLCDHQLFEVGHMKEKAREVGDYNALSYVVDVEERVAAARAAIDQALNEISNENDTEAHKD